MQHPNLLFLYTDEQAFNTLAAYGNPRIEMPSLNRLAQTSSVFEQAYVTQPVCTPSRSTLLTGLYPHTNGCTENNIPLRPDIPCLPEMITRGEYVTGHFGKWHLGDEIFGQHGFDEWVSIEDGYRAYYGPNRDHTTKSSYHQFLVDNGITPSHGEFFGRGQATRLPEEYGKPAFLGQEASRFIRANQSKPFALYVNFLEPHMPFFGPRDDQYNPTDIPLPSNADATPGPEQPLKVRLMAEHYRRKGFGNLDLKNGPDWQRMIANYWGLCSLVDTHVGTILQTLDDCGLTENTIIVFTSDHGDMMGSHGLIAKCVMYQEAVRVPLLIRLPGQRRGKRVKGVVSQIDVVPTLLDLLGQALPDHLQGQSLKPVLESEDPVLTDNIFIEWNGPNNGLGDVRSKVQMPEWMAEKASPAEIATACSDPVRTVITADGWKLNCSPLGEHELYNLHEDPGETENRFSKPRHAALRSKLLSEIRTWQKHTADTVTLPDF